MKRLRKAISVLVRPAYWPALARGVAPGIEHGAALAGRDFACVIDVGANKGQFTAFARHSWPRAQLICFEPLPGPRARLTAVAGGNAQIHPVALGDAEGEAVMHVASRADSSSLLPLGDTQKRLFDMDDAGQLAVPVRRLDAVVDAAELARPSLLKIDVQGFEYETLRGAAGLLGAIDTVYVEVSFVELYAGQKLAGDVAGLLDKADFLETGRYNVYRAPDGATIQADLLFERGG